MVAKPCHLLKVNSLRDNWPLERDFGDFRLKAGQQLHFKKGAEAGNSGDNRLGERQLTIDIVAEGGAANLRPHNVQCWFARKHKLLFLIVFRPLSSQDIS
jgi:hypothetical protein